jgi:hypothetical protein
MKLKKMLLVAWKKLKIHFYSKKVKSTNTLETKEMQTEEVRLVKYDRLTLKWVKKRRNDSVQRASFSGFFSPERCAGKKKS